MYKRQVDGPAIDRCGFCGQQQSICVCLKFDQKALRNGKLISLEKACKELGLAMRNGFANVAGFAALGFQGFSAHGTALSAQAPGSGVTSASAALGPGSATMGGSSVGSGPG